MMIAGYVFLGIVFYIMITMIIYRIIECRLFGINEKDGWMEVLNLEGTIAVLWILSIPIAIIVKAMLFILIPANNLIKFYIKKDETNIN